MDTDRVAWDAWDGMSDEDRKALFVGMYTFMQASEPGFLLVLEIIARRVG
jgi:hypothetical protein